MTLTDKMEGLKYPKEWESDGVFKHGFDLAIDQCIALAKAEEAVVGDWSEEFIREFCNDHNGEVRFLRGVFYDEKDGAEKIIAFISSSITQAIAEDRARVRGKKAWIQGNVISYKKPTYQSAFFEAEEVVILASLDTPVPDKE